MEGVNIKFKRLPEELLIDESGRTQPWQRRVKNLLETVPWRAVTVVLSLSSLVTIICLATAPSSKVDDVASLLHQRVDNVVNASRDMSISHEDQQQNLFEVRPDFAGCLSRG